MDKAVSSKDYANNKLIQLEDDAGEGALSDHIANIREGILDENTQIIHNNITRLVTIDHKVAHQVMDILTDCRIDFGIVLTPS
jgi:hypothetical protein